MKQILITQGAPEVEEVPAPCVVPGSLLVRVDHSCISAGTELGRMHTSAAPLWKRALQNPQKVQNVLKRALTEGISKTVSAVQGKLNGGFPTGYSAAGTVVEVGEGVEGFQVGDAVACAGAQCAYHAEFICVPRNLVVPIPKNVTFQEASTVTLGAIALQGIRRAVPTLGENFVVLGLGILGQITSQLLKSNGCRVIGIDLDEKRLELALELGMDVAVSPAKEEIIQQIFRVTDGIGADGVIITAASFSHEVISQAFKMSRRKGRVVLVGEVGLNLNRSDFYAKEIDFLISTSYGPGRYDPSYEEKGIDYPLPYVRWTENRNMQEYLRLLDEDKINVRPLISSIYPVEKAQEAYQALKGAENKPLMTLLSYPKGKEDPTISRLIPNPNGLPKRQGTISLALVGAGSFAKGSHLPNLSKLTQHYSLHAVMSRSGYNALNTAKQFQAKYATTDFEKVLNDSEIDAVLIATRHHLHAEMALKALNSGKHVLIEKPLALNQEELDTIVDFYRRRSKGDPTPLLLTGFNRRFSPHIQTIKEIISQRSNSMIITYRMNAGHIPLDHWVHSEEGGGRNIGEACHVYDLLTFLTESRVKKVEAQAIDPKTKYYSPQDNFSVTFHFHDGSLATVIYTALGSQDYPKEHMEVFVDGKVCVMENYKTTAFFGSKKKNLTTQFVEKGQKEEQIAFAQAIQEGKEWPIPLWQQIQAMEICFEVEKQINSQCVE